MPELKVVCWEGKNGFGEPLTGPLVGKWSVFECVARVFGPTPTITGEIVDAPPTAAWGHVRGCPWFATEAEAITALAAREAKDLVPVG